MRIPILIHGNVPLLNTPLPAIRLEKGNWNLVAENLIDSKLSPVPGSFSLDTPSNFQLSFTTKGTERDLNIYCEMIT